MKCRVCGAALEPRVKDLPLKVGDSSIVILKDLPVLQCRQCGDIELENSVMSKVSGGKNPPHPSFGGLRGFLPIFRQQAAV